MPKQRIPGQKNISDFFSKPKEKEAGSAESFSGLKSNDTLEIENSEKEKEVERDEKKMTMIQITCLSAGVRPCSACRILICFTTVDFPLPP